MKNNRWSTRAAAAAVTLAACLTAVHGAKNGVPGALPPFVPIPAPQPFLQKVSPFAIVGFLQTATLDSSCSPADPLCGGTMTVNGIRILVPRNTLFQMPATAIAWGDLFHSAPAPYGPSQSGLALSDSPKPFATYEVNVVGNRVISGSSDQYIAGLIFLSQQSLNSGQGYINFIDYAKGEIWVSDRLGAASGSGSRLRINTPTGRYGNPDPLADKRFTSDENNPTIRSRTGYPMCLPRQDPKIANDSLCPQWNRPTDPFTGASATIFTMSAAPAGAMDANGVTHQVGYPNPPFKPDPFEQAPFEIGDFVTFSGTLVNDAPCLTGMPLSSCQYLSAHTLVADLGIWTSPGTTPVYVAVENTLIGMGGTPNPLFPQEAVEKFRMDAFTTDPTQILDAYAVDVNSCTGARSHRFYGSATAIGPPFAGLKGRARFRFTVGSFLPATRDLAVASRGMTLGGPLDLVPSIPLVANGLAAGVYQAPDAQFVFPENLVIGSPQVPLPLQEVPFLVNGSGPYTPLGAGQSAAVVGQLSPWPSLSAPPSSCGITAPLIQVPVANAGGPQTVSSGASVTLDGSASFDPNTPPLPLAYTWVQIAGPTVNLLNGDAAKPQFTAPVLPTGSTAVLLTFQLAVCNGFTCSGIASVNVTVNPVQAPSVTLKATPGTNVLPGTLVTLAASASGGTPPYTYTFTQSSGTSANLAASGAQATFTAPQQGGGAPAALSFRVTVTDANKSTANTTITVYDGADTIRVTAVVYRTAKSQLQVTATSNAAPQGAAVLTVSVYNSSNVKIAPDMVMTYDPTLNTYNINNAIVNPIPDHITIQSSYLGTAISGLTSIK